MKKIFKTAVGIIAFLPTLAMAHPGHGHENPLSPDHYLANAEHSLPIALTLGVVVFAVWKWKKATSKK